MRHLFGYLMKFQQGRIVLNSGDCDNSSFQITEYDNWIDFFWCNWRITSWHAYAFWKGNKVWTTVYVDADHAHDTMTHHSVTAIILLFNNRYVDADHAHDSMTHHSMTTIILFVNDTPLRRYSKKHRMVEISTYGAELVTTRIVMNMIIKGDTFFEWLECQLMERLYCLETTIVWFWTHWFHLLSLILGTRSISSSST